MSKATAVPETESITELELWLVVDVSGSVRASGLQEPLERNLSLMKSALSDWTAQLGVRVQIRTLTFAEEARWTGNELLPGAVPAVSLHPAGLTNAGSMFRLLSQQLQGIKRGLAYVPPVILLISDGMPTDDHSEELTRFIELADSSDATRLCIALGPDASMTFCRSFTQGMAFDALTATTQPLTDSSFQSIASACTAILRNSKGASLPIPLPRSKALPAFMTTVTDLEEDAAILSANCPLAGKHFAAIAAIRLQTKPELPIELDQLLESAIEAAVKHAASPEDIVDLVAESLIAALPGSEGSNVQLLALTLATPTSVAIVLREDLLVGFVPMLSNSQSAWAASSLGAELRKRVLPEGISLVVSSPEFCESFGYGEQADALAAELTAIFRDRGASYVSTSRAAWAARARAMTGSQPFALAVLYDA